MSALGIEIRGLGKAFERGVRREALRDLSLDLEPGRMHGVIGPEGSGKTTLLRLLLGLLSPDAGTVRYLEDGVPADFEAVRPSIAYMPQTQSLYPDLSIEEHLEFFRDLYGVGRRDYEARREELLGITRLKEFTARPAGQLSGGMYKKLGLMCALLGEPRAMILDEPTTGVDPISRRELWDLLYRLLDRRILILVTTAYLDEAERCSKVSLLEAGRVVAAGEPRALLAREGARTFDELFLRRAAAAQGAA